jgi:hypothetical protein
LALTIVLGFHPPASAQDTPKPDVEALIQKLIDADAVERGPVMEQLDLIQDPAVIVPPTLAALERVDPQQSWKLLDVLARFPGAVKPAPLLHLGRRAGVGIPRLQPQLSAQLLASGVSVRAEIAQSISDACVGWAPIREDPPADTDEPAIEARNQARNLQAFLDWAAEVLGTTGSAGADDLLKMLRGDDACHQRAAQAGLSRSALKYDDKLLAHVMQGLAGALATADPAVQKSAMDAISAIVGFGRAALPADMVEPLLAILKSCPDPEARFTAFKILCSGPGGIPRKAAKIALHDPDENISDSALRFLGAANERPEP